MKSYLYYLFIVNIVSFIIYGLDKVLAIKRSKSRISERWLFLLSLLGGSLGCLIGMFMFRHKTKKIKFYLWNIVLLVVWCYLTYMFLF